MAEQVSQNVDQKVMSKVQCSAQNIHDLKKKKKIGWVRVVLVTCVYACSSRAKVCV